MYVTIKNNGHHFFLYTSDNESMNILAYFLLDDVGISNTESWLTWFMQPGNQDTTSNYSFVEKEDSKIILGCLFDEDPYECALTISISAMIDLLEQWGAVCKMNPDEVIIYYSNEKFTVEGKKYEL